MIFIKYLYTDLVNRIPAKFFTPNVVCDSYERAVSFTEVIDIYLDNPSAHQAL